MEGRAWRLRVCRSLGGGVSDALAATMFFAQGKTTTDVEIVETLMRRRT